MVDRVNTSVDHCEGCNCDCPPKPSSDQETFGFYGGHGNAIRVGEIADEARDLLRIGREIKAQIK